MPFTGMPFKFLPHTADVKILVEEKTLEKAFSTSASALKEVIAEKIKVKEKLKKQISIKENDKESLLYSFLEEFIYLLDAENFLPGKIKKLEIKRVRESFSLKARVSGDKASNYKFTNDVKAITYNEMFVKEGKNKTTIQFVLDV
jgi:SHS2 domain-containing protein